MVRQAHHPEPSRRAISKFKFPMIQTQIKYTARHINGGLNFQLQFMIIRSEYKLHQNRPMADRIN